MTLSSLRQLQYAVAVADQLSFRRAAETCHVSQPGLSAQVQELEQQLGVALFERSRRQVLVTEVGRRVVARARTILAEVEALERDAQQQDLPLSGTLRLGVIPTVAPYVLPDALVRLRADYPHCRLLLREAQTADVVEAVRLGKLDLALLALDVDIGGLHALPVYEEPFWLVVPEGHPLAQRKRVTDADLADQAVLLLEDGHCLRDQALSVCHMAGAHEVGDFRASSLSTLVEMVASGLGVSLLPEKALPLEVRPPRPLCAIPFKKPGHHRRIGLVWRAQSPRVSDYQLLAGLIRDTAQSGKRSAGAPSRAR
jgi:LysR family hydrogen peroxide-inducible transcriptional activator